MTSLKLLAYETKRIVLTKKWFYMVLILFLFMGKFLSNVILEGYQGTAPFSPWTYSFLLANLNPNLFLFIILLCMGMFSEKEEMARNIILATPFSYGKYYALKILSIGISILLIFLLQVIVSFIFYGYYFNFYGYKAFIFPIAIFFLPASIFVLGLATIIGKLYRKALYFLIPVIYLGTALTLDLPSWIDIAGNNTLYIIGFQGDLSKYFLPEDFLFSRIFMLAMGLSLLFLACRKIRCD